MPLYVIRASAVQSRNIWISLSDRTPATWARDMLACFELLVDCCVGQLVYGTAFHRDADALQPPYPLSQIGSECLRSLQPSATQHLAGVVPILPNPFTT